MVSYPCARLASSVNCDGKPLTHGSNTHAYVGLWPIAPGPYVVGHMPEDVPKPALNDTTRVFGERVRKRRQALRLSQEAAALRCGVHWTQLGKVERGQRSLRLETIVKIADGLEIDAGRLVSKLPVPSAAATRNIGSAMIIAQLLWTSDECCVRRSDQPSDN